MTSKVRIGARAPAAPEAADAGASARTGFGAWPDPSRAAGTAAGLVAAGAIATLLGALAFQHLFGYQPCPLCLQQRWPYYAAIPLAAVLAAVADRVPPAAVRAGLGLLAILFVGSAAFGAYHAGVEWGWWEGPRDCAAAASVAPSDLNALMTALQTTRVISCTEAAWRFLGLSLAGWNVVVSLALAAIAFLGSRPPRAAT